MVTEKEYLTAKKMIATYESERLNKTNGSSNVDTGGIDKYFDDLEKYENRFYCNECGCNDISDFAFERNVSNGQVWHCKSCKTELVTGHKPNEDKY